MRTAKTQISLGIRPVWSESSLSAWRKLGSLAIHSAHSEKTLNRLGGCPDWSESSLGAHVSMLVLSRGSLNGYFMLIKKQIWASSWQDQQNDRAPLEADQPGHPPSLIRFFAVRSMGSQGLKVSACGQRSLWSVWADAQADLSLRWAHRSFCWFCHAQAQIDMLWVLIWIALVEAI